jgi:predicted lipid-binding transport protein (Tim44 family)
MKKISIALLCLALVSAALCGMAEAKRMGGGGSFGSKPSYSRSYGAPSYAPSQGAAPTRQVSPQTAPTQTPMAGPGVGMGSRFGWGLGGFMAGGLLGSMLFGHGMGGWGGGMGLLDLVLLGLVAWLIVRLMRRRSAPDDQGGQWRQPGQQNPGGQPDQPDDQYGRAERSWDNLRSQPQQQPGQPVQAPEQGTSANHTGGFGVAPGSEAQPAPTVPEGFSVPDFLEGAKTVYARLQHSWDRRDMSDIALFTTAEVLDELKRQAAADPTPSKTELLLVNARLVEFREEASDTVASVLFDVLMREDAGEERPRQVREVWHFSRPTGDLAANWRLEGIQQLEG